MMFYCDLITFFVGIKLILFTPLKKIQAKIVIYLYIGLKIVVVAEQKYILNSLAWFWFGCHKIRFQELKIFL